jgi:hypothetical protein
MFRQIATQSPVEVFIQKKTHLGRRECMLSRFFQESDHLLALYARKSFEELLDRIASLQVIKQTFHWHTSAGENRLTTENFRILRYDAAHDYENTA